MFSGVGKGAVALIISGFVCKALGALFRLPLTSILGIEGIGAFQMIMSLYSLALVFVTGGVTNALAQLISSARARGDVNKIYWYFSHTLLLTGSVSIVIGIVFFFFAQNISLVQGLSGGGLCYKLFLLLIPVGGFIGVLRGIIQGYENMTPTAISQIIEQIFKVTLGLAFAYIFSSGGYQSGVFGGFLGIMVSEILALVYLSIYCLKNLKFSHKKCEKTVYPVLISAILPLSLSGAIIPFTHAFDSLVIISRLVKAGFSRAQATSLFGLQTGVVGAILNFPLIISLSLASTLLPKISYLSSQKEEEKQKNVIKNSFCAMWATILPLVFGILSISPNIYLLIYSSIVSPLISYAVDLTILGAFSIILTAIMQFFLSILQAKGHFVYSFLSLLFGGLGKIAVVYIFSAIPEINIFALPISNIVLALIVCVFVLIKLGKLVKIPSFSFFVPLLASIIMYCLIRLLARANLGNIIFVLLALVIGGITYFALAFPVIKSIFFTFFSKKTQKIGK